MENVTLRVNHDVAVVAVFDLGQVCKETVRSQALGKVSLHFHKTEGKAWSADK